MSVEAIVAEHSRLGKVEVIDVVYEKNEPKALIIKDGKDRRRQFALNSLIWVSDTNEILRAIAKRREIFAEQIGRDKSEGRKWLSAHSDELPKVGFRGAGRDQFTDYLRRAYTKLAESGVRHSRASFGGADYSPESVVSDLVDDAGTGGVLSESVPGSLANRVENQAYADLSRRDDASKPETPEQAEIIRRIAIRYGEALEIYFRHCVSREKCRDIAPSIVIESESGKWSPRPAICKKWALAIEEWILRLEMPLEQKASFLARLKREAGDIKKELRWRKLYAKPDLPDLDSKWEQLFSAARGSAVWWDRTRSVPDLPTKRYPQLLNNSLPENPVGVFEAKCLAGGRTWGTAPIHVSNHFLTAFGTMSLGKDDPAYGFVLAYAKQHPAVLRTDDFKPLPPIPAAQPTTQALPVKDEPKPRRDDESKVRRKAKEAAIENGLISILESPDFTDFEKKQFVQIADNLGMARAKLARKLKISSATLGKRIATLKKWGAETD